MRFSLETGVAAVLAGVSALQAEPTFFTARVAPIFEKHCVSCHGPEKQKAGLRLDTFEHAQRGGEAGTVIAAGNPGKSELFRRITLPADHDEVMPGDGKPRLARDEIKILELWIASGATATKPVSEFPTAPVPTPAKPPSVALTSDWRTHAREIAALQAELGVKLVPRSQIATDGLILRTASAPARCDDAAIAKLAPVARFIVDAELARTRISDSGVKALAAWENLRTIDLTRTAVTSRGIEALAALKNLEMLNLTNTTVDDSGVRALQELPQLKRIWLFGTKATSAATDGAASGESGK